LGIRIEYWYQVQGLRIIFIALGFGDLRFGDRIWGLGIRSRVLEPGFGTGFKDSILEPDFRAGFGGPAREPCLGIGFGNRVLEPSSGIGFGDRIYNCVRGLGSENLPAPVCPYAITVALYPSTAALTASSPTETEGAGCVVQGLRFSIWGWGLGGFGCRVWDSAFNI